MFALADFSVYVAIIGTLGEKGFDAVTASLTINFLARPESGDLTASVKLIRLGRRLAIGEVEIHAPGVPEMVAHATASYAYHEGGNILPHA
jgi:acyl-coenzyme A thioesterase PaaI-like protein